MSERQHLLIDADDTLWQNNVYFERAIDDFLDFLDHSTLSRSEVRTVLNEIERATLLLHGYGSAAFGYTLRSCYERLAEREIDAADLAVVMGYAERILAQEIELLPDVEQTLTELARRHDLVLFTKGQESEQRSKIERSGVDAHFLHLEVTPEKNEEAYRTLVSRLGFDPDRTWMIGNSPKSDILPALAAGLGAVYIPHAQTWRLEIVDLDHAHHRLITIASFRDLTDHFAREPG